MMRLKKLVKNAKMEPEEFDAFVENRRQKQLNEFYKFLENNNESDFLRLLLNPTLTIAL
jgi:hypothetical protein